jgi:peptidoglycan/LPS O-acetylase OafA/YrhL
MVTHAGVNNGGWLGVDVFFGLSGFLIASLLLTDADRPRALRSFVSRRMRRLLPAFLTMVMIVCGLLMMGVVSVTGPADGPLREAWWSVLYVGNWYQVFTGASYWAEFSLSPFGHLWSLSIEEQFYVLFPALIVALRKLPLPRRTAVLGVLAGSAAIWTAAATFLFSASRVYYGTDTRMVSLLTGAFAAVFVANPRVRSALTARRRILAAAGSVAFTVLVLGAIFSDGASPTLGRGMIQAAALSEAVLVSALVFGAGLLGSALSWSPLVWVGRRSYSLYLWHLPVFVFLPDSLGPWETLAVGSPIALMLAHVSYEMIEHPFRHTLPNARRRRTIAISTAFAICAVGLPVAVAVEATPDQVVEVASAPIVLEASALSAAVEDGSVPVVAADPVDSLMVVGDSVALTFVNVVQIEGMEIINNALLGCPTLSVDSGELDDKWEVRPDHCVDWRERLWTERGADADATLWMWGAWDLADVTVDGEVLRIGTPEYEAFLRSELQRAADELTTDDRRVYVTSALCHEDDRITEVQRRATVQNDIIEGFALETPRVIYLPLIDYLCDGSEQVRFSGQAPRPDGVHFSTETSKLIWEWALPYVTGRKQLPGDS